MKKQLWEKVPEAFSFQDCHRNAEINMYTKFLFHALYGAWFASLRSKEVVMGKTD